MLAISKLRGAHTIPCIKDGICAKPECSHLPLRRNKISRRHMAHPMSWPDTLVLPKVPTEAGLEQAVPSVIALDAVNAKSEPCPAFGHAAEASSEAPAPNQKSMNAGWPHTVLLDVHAAEIHLAQAMACDYAQDGPES